MRMSISPNELPLGFELLDDLEQQDPLIYPRSSDWRLSREYQAHRVATVVNLAARQRKMTVHTVVHKVGSHYTVEISKRPILLE